MHKKLSTASTSILFAVITKLSWAGSAKVSAAVTGAKSAGLQGQVGIDYVNSYTSPNTESQYVSPIKPVRRGSCREAESDYACRHARAEAGSKSVSTQDRATRTILRAPQRSRHRYRCQDRQPYAMGNLSPR